MKLTRKQIVYLGQVVYHLERARKFLAQDGIAVCRTDNMATTTLHYVNKEGKALYPIAKDIGSDLVGLEMGLEQLKKFLAPKEEC